MHLHIGHASTYKTCSFLVTQDEPRFATFGQFLFEEYPLQAAAAYLAARMACASVALTVTYIEYPLDRDGRPQWVCLAKALWVAEQALGAQAEPLQKAFAARLTSCCQPVGARSFLPAVSNAKGVSVCAALYDLSRTC